MPFKIDRGRCLSLALFAALTMSWLGVSSAQALTLSGGALGASGSASPVTAATLESAQPCSPATDATPFTAWGDYGSYTLAPGGSFEDSTPWLQLGGASVVSDNEPWYVTGDTSDSHALDLPSGSTAISPPMCVSLNYPWMRLFARELSGSGTLNVAILYVGALDDQVHELNLASLPASNSDWFLTGQIPLLVNNLSVLTLGQYVPVAFQFTPSPGSSWRIDDVYVDPFRRG